MKKILVVLFVIILMVGVGAFYLFKNINNNPTIDATVSNTPVLNELQTYESKVYERLANAQVVCTQEIKNVIPTKQAEFIITFSEEVPEDYVQSCFSIEDSTTHSEVKYDIVKESPKSYNLILLSDLREGEIYNVVETTTEGEKKWAFQTDKELKVSSTYPNDNKTADLDQTVQIYFNFDIKNTIDINDFVTIMPKVDGYWNKENSHYISFRHPIEKFAEDQTYTVSLKKGLQDEYGNEIKEDYSFSFTAMNMSNKKLGLKYLNIDSENVIKKNTKLSFDVVVGIQYSENKKDFSVQSGAIRVIELRDREDYISNMKLLDTDPKYAQKLWNAKNQIIKYENEFMKDKSYTSRQYSYWSPEVSIEYIETDYQSDEPGYYLALVKVDDLYEVKPFQISNDMASFSCLSTGELFIAYKNENNTNNRVDVYLNNNKLGTTDGDGILYVEKVKDTFYSDNFNFVEFNGKEKIIMDVTKVASKHSDNNEIKQRFNNGYLYHDRKQYKIGEPINIWGYARNRVYGVNEAKLVFTTGDNRVVEEVPLQLDELGAFKYTFDSNKLNADSYVEVELMIDGVYDCSRWINVNDYSIKQYKVDISQNGSTYVVGDKTTISIEASTYEDTPLSNVEFVASVPDNDRGFVDTKVKSLTTDLDGFAAEDIEFTLRDIPKETDYNYINVRVDNSYLDGGSEYLYYRVYPYKNDVDTVIEYNSEKNEYYLEFKEYNVKDRTIKGTDKIKVKAKAKDARNEINRTYIDEYTKKEVNNYTVRCYSHSEYDKEFVFDVSDGKATLTVPNWSDTNSERGFYDFDTYIMTDSDEFSSLRARSDYDTYWRVYQYDYSKNEWSKNAGRITDYPEYRPESAETTNDVKTITKKNDIPSYSLSKKAGNYKLGDTVEYELQLSNGNHYYAGYYYEWEGASSVGTNDYFGHSEYKPDNIDYSKFEIYALMISGRGAEILKAKNSTLKYKLTTDMGYNVAIYPLIFDGEKIYSPDYSNVIFSTYDIETNNYERFGIFDSINEEERELDIEVTFDKETYRPGDEATISLKATHKDKGEKTSINLSAIDMAYSDENGTVPVYIDYTVDNNYYFSASEISSGLYVEKRMYEDDRGGGDGGGGDGDRTKIVSTAFFESVLTNDNGEATLKVKLPDNITQWFVTIQGISKDYRAGSTTKNFIVTLPYYVGLTLKDDYIEDEKFAFNIKSMGNGLTGKDTIFNLTVLDANDNLIESKKFEATVGRVSTYKMINGLKEGKYKVRLAGECGDYKDSLVMPIRVRKTLLQTLYRREVEDGELEVDSPVATILVVNNDIKDIINELFELSSLKYYNFRYDCQVIGKEASRIIESLNNGQKYNPGVFKDNYELIDNIGKTMDNASFDHALLLRNLATKSATGKLDTIFERVNNKLGEEACLWARATQNEAVLKALRDKKDDIMANSANYTKEQVLYVALGLAEIGDYDNSNELLNIVSSEIASGSYEEDLYVALNIKLNSPKRKELYDDYIARETLPEKYNYIKLYYIQNEISRNFKEGKLVIKEDGQNKNIAVKNIGYTKYPVTNKSNYEIASRSDNIAVYLEDYAPLDVDSYTSKGIIKKSYSTTNMKLGDSVKVTIEIDNKMLRDMYGDGSYTIRDIMPNNLNFIEFLDSESSDAWYEEKSGQRLSFDIWASKYSGSKSKIVYEAKVSNDGDMVESGVLLLNNKNEIIDIIKY